MRKPVFSTELAYVVAMLLLAIGAAFITRADIGMSVVIAPWEKNKARRCTTISKIPTRTKKGRRLASFFVIREVVKV